MMFPKGTWKLLHQLMNHHAECVIRDIEIRTSIALLRRIYKR